MTMFIHFFCLFPLSLTIKLNFNISKVAHWKFFCEPLCSANFHDILYVYMQYKAPCSTETNTALNL